MRKFHVSFIELCGTQVSNKKSILSFLPNEPAFSYILEARIKYWRGTFGQDVAQLR
jgi:hypothetical protein